MKWKKYFPVAFVLLLGAIALHAFTAFALSVRISFSDPTAQLGNEVDVTMKVTSMDGAALGDDVIEIAYDASALEFVSGTNTTKTEDGKLKVMGKAGDSDKEYVYILKFKTLKAGETGLSVSSWGVYDAQNNMATLERQGSSKITVEESETTAAEESSAEETQAQVVGDASGTEIVVQGVSYDLAQDFDASLLPETFEKSEYNYKGRTVSAGKQADGGAVLMYLLKTSEAEISGNLFFYEESSDKWVPFLPFTIAAKSMTPYPLPAGMIPPSGFSPTSLELNGQTVDGWVWSADTNHSYAVIYGMNAEGEKHFYRYDFKEKTMQRYFEDPSIRGNTAAYADTVDQYRALQIAYEMRGKKLYGAVAAFGVVFLGLLFAFYRLFIIHRESEKNAKNTLNTIRSRRQAQKENQSVAVSGTDDSANGARKLTVSRIPAEEEIKTADSPEAAQSMQEHHKDAVQTQDAKESSVQTVQEEEAEKPTAEEDNISSMDILDLDSEENADTKADAENTFKKNGEGEKAGVNTENDAIQSSGEYHEEAEVREKSDLTEKKDEKEAEHAKKEELDERRKGYILRKNLIPTQKEQKILEGLPTLTKEYNRMNHPEPIEIVSDFEELEREAASSTIKHIESALEKSLEADTESVVYPIDDENYEAAKANEIKINQDPKLTTKEVL